MANLLAQMTLSELIDAVEADLVDTGNAQISAAEVKAAVRSAIYDINRFLPQQKIYELTLDITVTDEDFTSSHDTAVSLDNKPIEYDSEKVEETDASASYTRDTDYEMDYSNGTITVLSTGSMSDSTGYHISYKKSRLGIDISGLTDLIRIVAVEYPLGSVPKDAKAFSIWGDILFVGAGRDSQEKMGDTNHIVLYYEAEHNITDV